MSLCLTAALPSCSHPIGLPPLTSRPSPPTHPLRFQRLRKKGGLVLTDVVEVFYDPEAEADAGVLQVMGNHPLCKGGVINGRE